MTVPHDNRRTHQTDDRLVEALGGPHSQQRLQAAMEAGTRADPEYLEVLIDPSRIEPHCFVRDMLT